MQRRRQRKNEDQWDDEENIRIKKRTMEKERRIEESGQEPDHSLLLRWGRVRGAGVAVRVVWIS